MFSDELFSDDSDAAEAPRSRAGGPRGPKSAPLGFKRLGRLGFALVLMIGAFAGLGVEAALTASPAFAAPGTYTWTTPATGGTSATWYTGVANSQSIVAYGVSGVSGTSAYPASITLTTGSLPPGTTEATSTTSSPACTQSTSGSGTTEHYILTCPIADTPTPAQTGSYPVTFTVNPGTDGGTAVVSGTDTITVSNTTQTCIAPASGGTATTMAPGYTNTYTVQCENETHISGQALYPSSISIASGGLPGDANQTFATTTSSSPACTQTTSGSGTTEEYILNCALAAAPTAADAGSYPMTFTSTVDGVTLTSGTLTVTVAPETLACTAPAAGGTATTFNSSIGGTNNSYSVACYGTGALAATYPTSITETGTLPSDIVEATSTSSSPACTQTTSGSGLTEHYILTCPVTEDAVPTDNGSYTANFVATDSNNTATVTSGTWSLTVTGPSDVCTAPASGGTATTFKVGIANTYSVSCYGTGFGSANAGNYPTISLNTGTLPSDANFFPTTGTPACTQSTSGSGLTEEYIETCNVTESPTATDVGSYPVTFAATPGANGGTSVVSGTWTLTVAGIAPTCIDPASGGTATTFYTGTTDSYTVECEAQSGVSGVSAYPSSIAIASGALPSDASENFFSSTGSPACTTGTSGSGATEEYILECALTASPTVADAGGYPFTFTATGPGGAGTATSGTLTVTVSPPTTTCSTPAAGGTSASWVDGTAETETVICYSQGFSTANAGNYPSAITLNSGALPSDATEATSLTSSPACTTATSGSGVTEEYELECAVKDTPVYADNGTYHATFLATGGANGAPNLVSGTLTITISQPAPEWYTTGTTDGNYDSVIKGVPFCYNLEVSAGQQGPTGTNPGSTGSLPLTGLTAGTTPSGVTNYQIKNVNLTAGTAQLCGTNNNNAASAPVTMAPVATNSGGSATDSIPLWSQNECTWTASGGASVSMFDTNQDLEQAGTQSAFGQPISSGESLGGASGGTENYPTCTGGVGVSASGGLGDAWTMNSANPLPTPTDSNPSAALGDLPSSNLDLASADSTTNYIGGCWGGTNILASTSTTSFGGGSSTAHMTLPSSWSNGGDCAYGSLGSNSAGGNTDTLGGTNGGQPATGDANCPPDQADVNAGYVSCAVIVSSGNDENGSVNYSSMDVFFNGQPVPQTPTATLSGGPVFAGDTVSVTGGTNWWGSPDGAPDPNPTGDFQNGASDFYSVGAPSVYIGTSRATAVPVANSTITIGGNTYACTGAESTTVGPNPCTLSVGQPTGSFQVPSNLAPGAYNLYIDESNTSPLPGNGPNDSYQTATGRNLGTVEATTPITVEGPMVVKTATTAYQDGGYSVAGDQISYSYAVTNNGPGTLTNITVSDNKIPSADISCPSSSLASGASETCTATYTVTQADVDAGSVTNTATVSGTSPSGNTVTSVSSSVTVDASDATSSLSLTKSTTSTGFGTAGDTIPYSYLVTNTGTTTESNIAVSDNLVASVNCPDSTLAPGASETCTGTYTVTQADVDTGSVTNTATAGSTNPIGTSVTSASSSVTVEASNASSTLSLTKSTTSTGYGAAGDTISYSYLVTNTGTTTESNIAVSDNLVATVTCPDPTLAPGASETCTGTYTVTQADVDNGSVTNTATADGANPQSTAVTSASSSVTVEASNATSSLSLIKSSTSTGYGAAGDTISYSYLVTNTGTTTESNIAISDNLVATVTCPDPTLAPGASETCTGTYTVTQADVDNGSVTNTATAGGTNPQGTTVTSASSSVTVGTSNTTSSLSLVKSTTSRGFAAAGNTIPYSYLVDNTGTTTESNIAVSDNLIATVNCPDPTLAPGASETCTGTYTVTQADVDAGSVTNTATASGTNPQATTVTSSPYSITVLASGATSSLSLTKSTTSTGYGAVGERISYSYLVTNTGTTTESNIAVSDNLIASVNCPDSTLAPGASETCTGTYTVTQADVDAGSVTNMATASATDPHGDSITGESSLTVEASNASSTLSLTKSTPSTGYGAAGDTISYSYLVTNTGTTTESNIAISDNLVATVTCPDPTLAPGASETCTGTYTVTQADVDNGSVTNTATADGANPQSTAVTSASSSVTVAASNATSSLSLTKSTTSTGYAKAGNTIPYSYLVTNTGTTTESHIAVSDNKVATVTCPDPTLAPGAFETCTGTHKVTQGDVNTGSVTNTATAGGRNPQGTTVTSASSSVTVHATGATSSLGLAIAVSPGGFSAAGQVLTYSLTLTNTGTETLTHLSGHSSTLPAGVTCPVPPYTLAPGAKVVCTETYTTTSANVTARSVTNTATASAKNPQNTTVTSASATVIAPLVPKSLACTRVVGSENSTVTISGCNVPTADKLTYASASAPKGVALATGGTVTWSSSRKTTIFAITKVVAGGTACTTVPGTSEIVATGSVTGGTAAPAITSNGQLVSVSICLNTTTHAITIAPGTTAQL